MKSSIVVDAAKLAIACLADLNSINMQIGCLLVGRRCIIQSEFNGQPFGRSRKSMRGKMVTIRSAIVDFTSIKPRIVIFVDEELVGLELDEVVIVEESQP